MYSYVIISPLGYCRRKALMFSLLFPYYIPYIPYIPYLPICPLFLYNNLFRITFLLGLVIIQTVFHCRVPGGLPHGWMSEVG